MSITQEEKERALAKEIAHMEALIAVGTLVWNGKRHYVCYEDAGSAKQFIQVRENEAGRWQEFGPICRRLDVLKLTVVMRNLKPEAAARGKHIWA